MKYRNLGTVLGFDLTDNDGRSICQIVATYRPAKEENTFWVDIRLRNFLRVAGEMEEFLYFVDEQKISATHQDVKSKISLLVDELVKLDSFWQHVRDFSDQISAGAK